MLSFPYEFTTETQEQQPCDTISSFSWRKLSDRYCLASSSWDSTLCLYEVRHDEEYLLVPISTNKQEEVCLTVNWHQEENSILYGSIDGGIGLVDLGKMVDTPIGLHKASVKEVFWFESVVCSLSYDQTFSFWDPRQKGYIASLQLDYKPYCADLTGDNLAIALSRHKILLLNLKETFHRQYYEPTYQNSPLGMDSNLTSIALASDSTYLAIAGDDGRSNVSKITKDLKINSKTNFKAHRQQDNLYPVHNIGFHPQSESFIYTAGGDGSLCFWDFKRQAKIHSIDFNSSCITRSRMSLDGKFLAYALGYDWAKGINGYQSQPSSINVHIMQKSDIEAKKSK